MINFHIDDSGSISLNDVNQPILLFSAVCVPGEKYNNIKGEMTTLVDNIIKDINQKLVSICSEGGNLTPSRSEKFATFFLENVMKNGFEIHCAEIMRGDGVYMLFDADVRSQYLINVLTLIKKYNLEIITVYCDKEAYKNMNNMIDESELENKKNFDIASMLLKKVDEYLKGTNEQGCIVIDEGNHIINKVMIPGLDSGQLELEGENLSRYIQQAKSHENVLIQLADVVAYTTNMNLSVNTKIKSGKSVSLKNKKRAGKLYKLIESNNDLVNILSEQNEEPVGNAS
ncbi:MAG: DUF3800 domain-containing protein [Peptostreptococcaceae bacterium]